MADESFPIEVEQRGNVVVWTIDREARMNSLSRPLLFAFGKLAREAVSNPSVRAIVITGRGDKAFCAGADLKERQGMSENDIRVPRGQAQEVDDILTAKGGTVETVYYPAEGHGFRKRENQLDALRRTVAWFDTYLKPAAGD